MNTKNKFNFWRFFTKYSYKLKHEGIGHEKVLPRRLYGKLWVLFNDLKYPT